MHVQSGVIKASNPHAVHNNNKERGHRGDDRKAQQDDEDDDPPDGVCLAPGAIDI